jgi:Leucine-rich repeat (LRR) protein
MSNKMLSLTGTTPLDKALQYLVTSNSKTGVRLSTCNEVDKNRLRQRFAYQALIYSTGMQHKEASWFSIAQECQWMGITCNANKTVSRFVLPGTLLLGDYLTGTIPEDVGLWTGLTYFDVTNNRLAGSLPSSIGLWTGLKYFFVSDNQLAGSLPSAIGLWTGLTRFNVFNNILAGSLPSSIGLWTGLKLFYVLNNRLVGPLPSSIGSWTNLTGFDVSYNRLQGTVPKDVSKWTSIEEAYFNSNMFTGTMPTIGNGFCPKKTTVGNLFADCKSEIVCSCCNICRGI